MAMTTQTGSLRPTGPFHLAENQGLSRYFVPLQAYLRLKAEFLLGNLTHREPGERPLLRPLSGLGITQTTRSAKLLSAALPFFGVCSAFAGDAEVAPSLADRIAEAPTAQAAFEIADRQNWDEVFYDPCTGDWTERWFLDGEIAAVRVDQTGMELAAGPQFGNHAHHAVLWTKDSFAGDLKISYDYTRTDFETSAVNILYVQATGSGDGPHAEDIHEWRELRKVPSMSQYFNNMNLYHISYAAFPNTDEETTDYVRARRYLPEKGGLQGTEIQPDYSNTGLFAPGVKHRMTVFKIGDHLLLRAETSEQTEYFHWHNTEYPPIEAGRIGLRHMFTRSAVYRDFRVSVLDQKGIVR